MTAALSFDRVWVEYGEKIVLEKISLKIEEGAFVSIIGPSGAGKSTFLRLALGQERPSRGVIRVGADALTGEPGPDRGVVFQRYSVFPHLSAVENVVFGLDCAGAPFRARLSGRRRKAAREEALAALDAVGLAAAADLFPSELSGGMQQRLAIAQALIMKPRILLLDEPFGALDPGVRLDMHELLTALWTAHRLTVLMVTHDIKEAFKLGTRVLAFDKRRHDPHAPHRFGSVIVYDVALDRKSRAEVPQSLEELQAPAS